jgi:predicted acylesterase/phospholipase RssA
MLSQVTGQLTQFVVISVLTGLVAAALSLAAIWITRARRLMFRAVLEAALARQRTQHYEALGLRPRASRLREQVREEADLLLADPTRTLLERDPEVLVDVKQGREREQLIKDLRGAWSHADARWRVALLLISGFFAASCVLVSPAELTGEFPLAAGVVSTRVLQWGIAAMIAWGLLLYWDSRKPLPEFGDWRLRLSPEPALQRGTADRAGREPEQAPLGGPGQVVRTLHLSSGGFDTMMHLGVAHALWVIQGRAPDAIVGVSAGAIQGVAIAEILQASEAGEKTFVAEILKKREEEEKKRKEAEKSFGSTNAPAPAGDSSKRDEAPDWRALTPAQLAELQSSCLLARAHRLRRFIENAQRAPERLLDVLLPDRYQINTRGSVQPLRGPQFPAVERQQRIDQLKSVTGLAQLYNDLLDVPFSFGTLTRSVRRYLGFIAAGDLPTRTERFLVRCVELLRIWVLVGQHLPDTARLLTILRRALQKPMDWVPLPQSAGALLFQSRTRLSALCINTSLLVALALFYGFISDFVAVPLYLLAGLGLWICRRSRPDDVLLRSAWTDALAGLKWFVLTAAFWTAAGLSVVFLGDLVVRAWWPEDPLRGRWTHLFWAYATLGGLLTLAAAGIYRTTQRSSQHWLERFLKSYDLANSIFTEHGLRAFLVETFDHSYYPRAKLDRIVDAALKRHLDAPRITPEDCVEPQRTVGYYSSTERLQPIHLGLAVADTETGQLEVVSQSTSVVEGLLAATAVVPWMPAKELEHSQRDEALGRRTKLFIDGANVSREPTRAFLKMVRDRLHDAKVIHIYSVTPLPVSRPMLGEPRPEPPPAGKMDQPASVDSHDLVKIAWRALRLKRYRDATLERRLIELFSEMIPGGSVLVPGKVDGAVLEASPPKPLRMFKAWMTPVELEFDADVNRRILGATKDARRRVINETIADGCRAALQVMIARDIGAELGGIAASAEGAGDETGRVIKCSEGVKHYLARAPIPPELKAILAPGSDDKYGPGLCEICRHCCLWRNTAREKPQSLLLGDWAELGPSWPHERSLVADTDVKPDERFKVRRAAPSPRDQVIAAMKRAHEHGHMVWPVDRPSLETDNPKPDRERPTVSLLFAGGVFRGVYQMGVLNALHELGVRPDLIAGASVGSITAAMVADAFAQKTKEQRKARIARLASVYLTIDRLVLTDRLADFVRNLTLRAADTRFSIRAADRLFRRYDAPKWAEFDQNARDVIAGIERLFHVSPYELNRIVSAFRSSDVSGVACTLQKATQQYLDRMQIGEEALGAEALEQLISEYVVGDRTTKNSAGFTIDELRTQSHLQFLATATNLTQGRLDVFGETPAEDAASTAVLKEVLLASSAFPAVFRPRWSWEVVPGDRESAQYIDGGVTDNLPVDAVAQFLERASSAGLIQGRPLAPHLVVAASLEVNAPEYVLEFTRRQLKQSWRALGTRAKSLGHNRKLDTYASAQDRLSLIAGRLTSEQRRALSFQPVDLMVVAVKPDWLCGTFSFHPMLGFTRTRQARSIAHGCASTLLRFATLKSDLKCESDEYLSWMRSWNLELGDVPDVIKWPEAFAQRAKDAGGESGDCWLRKGRKCPFSAVALRELNADLSRARAAPGEKLARNSGEVTDEMIAGLDEIYRVCAERNTHLREI